MLVIDPHLRHSRNTNWLKKCAHLTLLVTNCQCDFALVPLRSRALKHNVRWVSVCKESSQATPAAAYGRHRFGLHCRFRAARLQTKTNGLRQPISYMYFPKALAKRQVRRRPPEKLQNQIKVRSKNRAKILICYIITLLSYFCNVNTGSELY